MQLIDRAALLSRRRPMRLALGILAFGAVTLITCLIAHPRMFSGFANYDDEGYMLTALKGFVNHGHLYDDVFSQYGPFYYEAWGGLFSLFGIPVDHDSGRTAVMVAWVLTSLLAGLVSARITASIWLGLVVQMLVFSALSVFPIEPMHPGSLICLLLVAILAIACFVRERVAPYAMAALGAALAALVLVKINVGGFALVSVALACAVSYPVLSSRRWLRLAIEVAFVALPILLMLGKFGEGWARHYALHVAVAALAVVIVLRAGREGRRSAEELGWLVGGFLVLAAAVCLAILAAGTTPAGLFDGILGQPIRQADAFSLPLSLSKRVYGIDLIALAGAVAYAHVGVRRSGPPGSVWIALTSLASIGIGIALALSVAGRSLPFDPVVSSPLALLGFCWVALIAPVADDRPAIAFARLLLPLLAVLQALHAYPVAGSQALWSSFLLIPVGAICVANGTRGIATVLEPGAERRALAAFAVLGAAALVWFVANATLRENLAAARAAYDDGVSLGLPGAGDIHVSPDEAAQYQAIVTAIDRNCEALVMLPGMDSFYLWARQEPPTGFNATGWPSLFDHDHQQRVIDETRSIDGLCVLENAPLAQFWEGYEEPTGTLVEYMRDGFRPVVKVGEYQLSRRDGPAQVQP